MANCFADVASAPESLVALARAQGQPEQHVQHWRAQLSLLSALSPIRLPHSFCACDVSFDPSPPMVWFVYFQ